MKSDLTAPSNGAETPVLALRPREAAVALGISPRTLWSVTADQTSGIPHVRLGKCVICPVEPLRAWLAGRAARTERRCRVATPSLQKCPAPVAAGGRGEVESSHTIVPPGAGPGNPLAAYLSAMVRAIECGRPAHAALFARSAAEAVRRSRGRT